MFHFRVTNALFHFELLKYYSSYSMSALLFSHFRVTNVKLMKEKNSLNITVSKACFFVSTYLIFVWVCWILIAYTSTTTHLQDYRRYSVDVRQRKNDHMQTYIIIIGRQKNFFIWNSLTVDRLTGSKVNVFVKYLRLVLVYRLSRN